MILALICLLAIIVVALGGTIYGNTSTGKYFRQQHEEFNKRYEKNLNK